MKDYKVYAPIIIPTLCRYEHLKRCIESLSRCTYADKTELVIGLDYPLNNFHWEGYKRICDYVDSGIIGFKTVTTFKRKNNFGVLKNFEDIKEYALKNYDRFIFSEDDNEFSPNFLDYTNWGLETFKDDKSVLAICGFKRVAITNYQNNVYRYPRFNAWGFGIWDDRDQLFENAKDHALMKNKLNELPLSTIFSDNLFVASSYMGMIAKNEFLYDSLIPLFPNPNMHCIFPTISKVRNYGHDGQGIHGGSIKSFNYYTSLPIDTEKNFIPIIKEALFQDRFDKIYKRTYNKIKKKYFMWCMFQFFIYKLTGKIFFYK